MRSALMQVARPAVIRRARPGVKIGRSVPMPAPVGGLNARDSVAMLPPSDAAVLDNFFPGEGCVDLRKGFTGHATGVGSGDVDTLFEFDNGATQKLLAAGGGAIYDATSSGAASSLGSGFTNNRWQAINFNGSSALVNGADAPQEFNGSTIANLTISGLGLTVANLIGVNVFKSRTYWWEDNSQDFWSGALNVLGGALVQFPLSRVSKLGGKLVLMASWTLDGGSGVDDLAVFVMSSGEVLVYQGTDPSVAADWSLVGNFKIGEPLGVRSVTKLGGDVVIGTKDGYAPLSKALPAARLGRTAISNKIAKAVVQAGIDYGANYGWQAVHYPRGNRILFNVPLANSLIFHQHVLNTTTGAWCRFTGMNGPSWGVYQERLYFGGIGGQVYRADDGKKDDGGNIEGDAQTAWSYFGDPGQRKQVTAIMPLLSGSGDLPVSVAAQADFRETPLVAGLYLLATGIGTDEPWDIIDEDWDVTDSTWQDVSDDVTRKWIAARGVGYAIGARLLVQTQESVRWFATIYKVKPAGAM